ncbi:MAG TPA: hypothetical protein VH583_17610 [Vicinamibacterales bacterium]|jgi:hypothetical protein
MAEFNVRSDAVNVEQIMEQIRSRIREKRGVDYTEEQIRELASVKLQKFLDPRGVRSDLLEQYRKTQPPYQPPNLPNYAFEDNTLFDSHRGGLRFIRRLLNPILKLFFNPNPLIQALHIQSQVNTMLAEREARLEAARRSTESLYYELIHNLVVETTRLGIEVKNLTMRIESMSSRLEFNERRGRALESAVVYKPVSGDIVVTAAAEKSTNGAREGGNVPPPGPSAEGGPQGEGPGQRSRRRRRRRGRRGNVPAAAIMGEASPAGGPSEAGNAGEREHAAAFDAPHRTSASADAAPSASTEPAPAPAPSSDPGSDSQ